jgi:hypothetical protein
MKILDVPSSGSYQGLVHSRNRFGQYVRSRSTPVQPRTSYQTAVRARQSTSAAAWRGLTSAQRLGWADLGGQIFRTDALGQSYTLTGLQAFVSLNNNLAAAGDSRITDAPGLIEPAAILSLTPTITPSSFSIAFTPTPLGSGERIYIFASPQRSGGRGFEHDYRLIVVSAAAATSPQNILSAYTSRFGVPVLANRIFVCALRYTLGFISPPLITSSVVTT